MSRLIDIREHIWLFLCPLHALCLCVLRLHTIPIALSISNYFHLRRILCGSRVRVEHSYGPSGGRGDTEKRRPPQRSFSPSRSRSRSRSRGRHRVRAPRTPSPLSPRSRSLSRSSERSRGRGRSSGKWAESLPLELDFYTHATLILGFFLLA